MEIGMFFIYLILMLGFIFIIFGLYAIKTELRWHNTLLENQNKILERERK